MATHFAQTLVALSNDGPRRTHLVWVMAAIGVAAWMVWFATAPVTLTTLVDAENLVNLRGQFRAAGLVESGVHGGVPAMGKGSVRQAVGSLFNRASRSGVPTSVQAPV